MNWPDIYLFCFAVGVIWTALSLLLGGLRFHLPKISLHGHVPAGGHHWVGHHASTATARGLGRVGLLLNPNCIAIFMVWFGGAGYVLTRYSALALGVGLVIASVLGLAGALLLAIFLRFLESHEKPLDPADYEIIGVLGTVSSAIRPDGIGELIYLRDGARQSLPARSEEGIRITRGEEVVVTRYEKGIAYVRTWEALAQSDGFIQSEKSTPQGD